MKGILDRAKVCKKDFYVDPKWKGRLITEVSMDNINIRYIRVYLDRVDVYFYDRHEKKLKVKTIEESVLDKDTIFERIDIGISKDINLIVTFDHIFIDIGEGYPENAKWFLCYMDEIEDLYLLSLDNLKKKFNTITKIREWYDKGSIEGGSSKFGNMLFLDNDIRACLEIG